MIKFSEEQLSECVDDIEDLVFANFNETAYSSLSECDINYESYIKLQEQGLVKFFVVKSNSKIIGYAVFLVTEHSHMKGSLVARQDALYVGKQSRGVGDRFIKWCENKLELSGVMGIIATVRAEKDHSKYYESLGYKLVDRVYLKGLKSGNRDSINNRGASC